MRKATVLVLGFLALSAVVGFLATSGGIGSSSRETAGGASMTAAPFEGGAVAGLAPSKGAAAGVPSAMADQSASLEGGGGTASLMGVLPPIGLDIVKTATISIEVKKGAFETAFSAAASIAGRYGGYVESSSTAGTKTQSGDLTIRVPSASFEQVRNDLRGLGTVQSQSISGQDVTAQFVDLGARLRTWQAQEAVLLKLMRQATSVESTLRVQNELQDVQFRIEQIKGQLRVLENQTSLATIQVSLHEAGAPIHNEQVAVKRPSLGEAWDRALAGFLGVIYAMVVGLGYLVPVTVIALVAWFGYRRLRPRPAMS